MYAIIDDSGRQLKVTSGQTVRIDRTVEEDQKQITFDRVLLVGGEGEPKVGAPVVAGATVTADVLGGRQGAEDRHRQVQAPQGLLQEAGPPPARPSRAHHRH